MHGDIPAACPCSAGSRCDRPVTSSHTCSRSVSDPSVATTPSPTAPDGSASVQAAGISDLLPSGSTSNNSTAPCRRIPPNTGNDWPCNGWRGRVIRTDDGKSSMPVVRRGFVRFRVDHALMVKAVEAHADVPWVVLYVKRWLSAPLALPDGTLRQRDRGTPQGSAVSPVLANLFMHYAFDAWMVREYPNIRFERYADDAVVHCVTERQARTLVAAIGDRMEQVGLRLHPDKTKVVYCQDGNRRLAYGLTAFTFLGFTFRARAARTKHGTMFVAFQPAISKDAQNKISGQIRRWRLHRWIGLSLAEIARQINPVVRGWMQYYGAFYRSALNPLLSRINAYVMRWIRNKYKRLRTIKKAKACWQRITRQHPRLFAHWAWVHGSWWTG